MSDVSKLGQLLDETAQRDAIHIALAPVTAGVTLKPGAHVGIVNHTGKDGGEIVVSDRAYPHVGIVDPFLVDHVQPGQRVWLCLYQQTITALRHRWEHPAFDAEPDVTAARRGVSLSGVPPFVPEPAKVEPPSVASTFSMETSEAWLREWCASHDCPSWETVRQAIEQVTVDDGDGYGATYGPEYITFYGQDAHAYIPAEFWVHVEVVLGRQVEYRPSSFSCSC